MTSVSGQERRARRHFSGEEKAAAVAQVLEHKLPMSQVARELGLTLSALRNWVKAAEDAAAKGEDLAQVAEIKQLRKDLARAKEEIDILKKAAAYFARTSR